MKVESFTAVFPFCRHRWQLVAGATLKPLTVIWVRAVRNDADIGYADHTSNACTQNMEQSLLSLCAPPAFSVISLEVMLLRHGFVMIEVAAILKLQRSELCIKKH